LNVSFLDGGMSGMREPTVTVAASLHCSKNIQAYGEGLVHLRKPPLGMLMSYGS